MKEWVALFDFWPTYFKNWIIWKGGADLGTDLCSSQILDIPEPYLNMQLNFHVYLDFTYTFKVRLG